MMFTRLLRPSLARAVLLSLLALLPATAALRAAAAQNPEQVEAQAPRVRAEFDSPRATMFTFLAAVNAVTEGNAEEMRTAVATLDLSLRGVDPNSSTARRLARDLWSALNHIRQVDESELPSRNDLQPDQTSFVYFPRPFAPEDEAILERASIGDEVIEFARGADGRWLFSAATVAGISDLAAALAALPEQVQVDEEALEAPAWVRAMIPASLRGGSFLGVWFWQWLALLLLIFLGLVTDYLVRSLLGPFVRRFTRRFHHEIDPSIVRDMVRALGLFGTALVWTSLVRLLYLADPVGAIAVAATGVFAVLAGTLAGWRLTDLVGEIMIRRAAETQSKFDDILVPLLRKTAKLFIIALGVVYTAQNLNINIVPLLTGLGIGGLAFAFAAKDTIENLFGSVAVVLDRPFEVGDWVVIGEVEGTVEELGFRSTRVRTFYNSQVTVPNAALVRAQVDNYGRRTYRRWKTTLGVQYDTSPEKLLAFTEGIRELVRQHPHTRKDYYQVWCNDFGDSSLNILVYVFHEVPDWSTELRERERLFIDIVRLADSLGVEFAFPTRTVHLYSEEHRPPATQYRVPHGTSDQDALSAGARAAQEITAEQPWQRERPGAVSFPLEGQPQADSERGGDA
jgi:MscS family membrane protein